MSAWEIAAIIAIILLVLLAALTALTAKMFRLGLFRGNGCLKAITDQNNIYAPYADVMAQGMEWFARQHPEEVELTSSDGIKLRGYYLPAEQPRAAMLLVHGFRSSGPNDFSCALRFFHEQGISLLLPDQRASGRSDGDFVTLGVRERYDCMEWLKLLCERAGSLPVFLDGISMGAATVLLMSELGLPESVRGIIADCGFTSPWEEVRHVIGKMMHLPVFPIIQIAERFTRRRCGFSLKQCDTVSAMRTCRLPVLFVHGTADEFVPVYMSRRNYDACAGEKELLLIPNAGHGLSFIMDNAACTAAVERFFDRYI